MGLDVFFGVVVLLMALRGYSKGFANQMIQITGIVVGVIFAGQVADYLFPQIGKYMNPIPETLKMPILYFICMMTIWLVISVVCSTYLMRYRNKVFGENKPSGGDRFFGIGLGLAEGALVCLIMIYGIHLLPEGIRNLDLVKKQIDESGAIKTAAQYPVVEWGLQSKEAQQIWDNGAQIVHYFRTPAEGDAAQPGADPNVIQQVNKLP